MADARRVHARAAGGSRTPVATLAAVAVAVAALAAVALTTVACLGPSTGELATRYTELAEAADTATSPLILALASASEPATRAPIFRGLADAERSFADGLAALSAAGPVQAAIDAVAALSRDREGAYRSASRALTREAQDAALAPILGAGGDAFGAAVGRLRTVFGLPPAGSSPSPDASAGASPRTSSAP